MNMVGGPGPGLLGPPPQIRRCILLIKCIQFVTDQGIKYFDGMGNLMMTNAFIPKNILRSVIGVVIDCT